jgi:ubiquinone/menaquinone biosynthesis C-methylase UbiE
MRKEHWEKVFETKKFDEVSWYQSDPKTSTDLIVSLAKNKNIAIIDIGGGDSNLVDKLINLSFTNISVLDISSFALEKSKERLNEDAVKVNWIVSDIAEFKTNNKFDIWHDRAAFHFLTQKSDIESYLERVSAYIKSGGYFIVATFSLKGPKKCSGLDIQQYSEASIKKVFKDQFIHIRSFKEIHKTPSGVEQGFIWNIFRRR